MTTDKKELVKKLAQLRKEISVLRTELNQIDEKKEEFFNRKEDYSKEIKALIKDIRDSKSKRDSLTKDVKEPNASVSIVALLK